MIEEKKGICIENKILLVIIIIAIAFTLKHIFILLKINNISFMITDILFLIIYGVTLCGIVKNNKSWAWIIASVPILWYLFNPLKPSLLMGDSTYNHGILLMAFQAIFNSDPQTAIQKAIESIIPLMVLVFITGNIFRFRKK